MSTEHARSGLLSMRRLLGRAVAGRDGRAVGRVNDVIVRLRTEGYPSVTGLVADVGGRRLFVPAGQVDDWTSDPLALTTARVDLRAFERREGEVLLRADILGHRLIDTSTVRLVRAHDLELAPVSGSDEAGWVLVGVDTRPASWWQRIFHESREAVSPDGCRDWSAFEALIGHTPSVLVRAPLSRLHRLKTPQIADLLEAASVEERAELLDRVHADPELEADVFEELDDPDQAKLLRGKSDEDVAAVLAHMRADDAADALMDLPQDRRVPVMERMPAGAARKLRSLLGFNPTSAGGLMALDHLALRETATVADALDAVRSASDQEPQALTTIYAYDDELRLTGAVGLVTLVQADPGGLLATVAEANPVRVGPETDLPDVAVLMTDYNLLVLPVVDEDDRLLGVITVDDALEATLPEPWRRREPGARPAHHTASAGS
ncbi:CBS domain-containing protein [Actinomycetospora endophytica]|uniref:CBS domain-containing protein n=1 Tax=Actinomycetospora endophytica TaxID=2291215 RepID=A0ABS8PAD5_9PSEU|nr:CBS domain-containing protein [Actinomycetospora endophytica]MCD2195183.1 CBS domain-containing protein [Actinomycetospora endophytica]